MALLLLAGCQQTAHKPTLPLQAQLITSLRCWPAATSCAWTAGAAMCRTMSNCNAPRCGRRSIAAGIRRRQGIGSCRRSPARYLTLQQDNQLLTDKCTTLSRSTARFIAAAQADQEDYME